MLGIGLMKVATLDVVYKYSMPASPNNTHYYGVEFGHSIHTFRLNISQLSCLPEMV